MLKRLGFILLALAFTAPAFAQEITNALTRRGIGGIPECKDSRVFCVGKQAGAEYSLIGGRDCTNENAPNASGSALWDALPVATDPNNPVIVRVTRGLYQECLAIDPNGGSSNVAVTDSLILHLDPGVVLRPAVTTATSVDGGVITVGAVSAASAQDVVKNLQIIAYGAKIQNDAFSPPEAALQIEREACTNASAVRSWSVEGGTWIGAHDSIQWCLDARNSHTNTDIPTGIVKNLTAIGGADNIVRKGNGKIVVQNVFAHTMTNYCESSDTTITDARTGTVADTGTTTSITLDASENATLDAFVGRKVTLSAGTCAAGHDGWATDYTTGRVLTFHPAAAFTPDNTCTYDIAVVPNANVAPCRDIDWTVIRAGASSEWGYWKCTCWHDGSTGPTTQASDADLADVQNMRCIVDVNDFGPEIDSTLCTNTTTGQQFVAGWLSYSNRRYQSANLTDADITVNINADLADTLVCAYPVGCVVASEGALMEGTLSVSGLRCQVNNSGDDDENMAAVVQRAANAHTMRLSDAVLDLNDTIGSSGTATHIIQTNTGTIVLGDGITSPETLVISHDSADLTLMSGTSSTGAATLDFGSITSDCVEVVNGGGAATITVPGAAAGDSCHVGVPTASNILKSSWTCRVSAANTATVKHCCNNGTCDPASGTFTATVRRQ